MASLCVKTRRGKVEVHDNEVASALTLGLSTTEMDKINTKYEYMKRQKKTVKRPKSTPPVGSHNAPSMNTASLTKNITTMQECRHTKDFAEDLGDFLSHIDMMALRKKELLHKNWTDRVYEPIRRKIVEAMGSQQQTENYRRRQVLYQQFLEHVNKKGHVFLDTVDKREYNAQALNYHRPAPLSVYHPILKDPLHLQGMERSNEDQVILRCITGNIYTHKDLNQLKLPNLPLVPQGRHGTDSTSWLEMPLFNIESTPRKASRESKCRNYGNSENGVYQCCAHRLLSAKTDSSNGGTSSCSSSSSTTCSSKCPCYWSQNSWHDARFREKRDLTLAG